MARHTHTFSLQGRFFGTAFSASGFGCLRPASNGNYEIALSSAAPVDKTARARATSAGQSKLSAHFS